MQSLSNIIKNVINGQNNFCCLCLKIDHNIAINDEINIDIGETGEHIAMSSIIQTIFGDEILDYWSTFESICKGCLNSLITVYAFIQTCINNATFLTHTLNSLESSLNCKGEHTNSKTLFVSINTEDLTINHTYDQQKEDTISAALERYKFLNSPVLKAECLSKSMINSLKPISDMILNPKDKILRCKECLKAYSSLHKLRIHFVRVHTPKNYRCEKCSKVFRSARRIEDHISKEHLELVCSECGKKFGSTVSFKRHELSHHMRLVCPDCGRTYKSSVSYKKHIELNICNQERRANPADAKYTCDYCGKKYTQKMSLRVHIQYTHGNYKAHVCKWCDKKFWAQSRLKAHIVKHTKEKKFSCSICQGKFVTKESLLYHTRLHTGEKPYKCSLCDCSFISSSRKAHHIRTYHSNPVVECDSCHSKFTSQAYLVKHRKSHKKCQKAPIIDNVNIKKKWKAQDASTVPETKKPKSILLPQMTKPQNYCMKNDHVLADAPLQLCVNNESYILIKTEYSN